MGSRLESNSNKVRKRIAGHTFDNEEGEEYESSRFGGFSDYFRRKKIKLQNLDVELRSSSDNPPIFRGVVAHVNGYTQPSLNDLHSMIVSYGGGFMQYLDGKTTVTHIIASNLTPKKKVEFAKYRIVKPAWVVDSIKAGKLLPWDAYRVLDEGIGQRVLGFEGGSIKSQSNPLQKGYRDQTETSWYTSHVSAVANELDRPDGQEPLSPATSQPPDGLPERDRDATLPVVSQSSLLEVPQPGISIEDHKAVDDDPGKENELYMDLDQIPAVDDSFTESTSGTQHRAQTGNAAQEVPGETSQGLPRNSDETHEGLYHAATNTLEAAQDESEAQTKPQHDPDSESIAIVSGLFDLSHAADDPPGLEEQPETETANLAAEAIEGAGTSFKALSEMTPEEHNALLLADPKIRKSTVVNPAFLKQYYEESRLHHLSAWKASLKSQLQALASEKPLSQKAREKRPQGARRYILHVDFDSFFAAVSLKKYPQFVEKPVVIAHGNGAGAEIASSNYPARKFGIKNGMWMKNAQKMCPDLKVLPYDFKAYEEASRHFYEAIIQTGGVVQSVSVDEALVDVSVQCIAAGGHDGKGIREGSVWREDSKAEEIAQGLRNKVKEMTGCDVSVGIGGNILLAKVALRKAKPAGQYHIKPEDALDFLGGLSMQDLPGIAWSIGGKLEEIGVKYVRDVRSLSKERMISVLGPKTGEKVWDYSRGIDRVEVGEQVVRKSVSAEVNWGIRFVTQEQAEEFVQSLCDELHKRLVNEGVKGKQLTMKIMRRAADAPLDPPKHLGHGKCDTYNKSVVLGVATNEAQILGREAISILRGWGFSPGELRGIGCQMQKLEPIMGLPETLHDSSQKRLQFKAMDNTRPADPRPQTESEDIESPQKPRIPPTPHPAAAFAQGGSASGKTRAPLNVMGTQFVIPSQIDPDTLAELPSDIRRKLFLNAEAVGDSTVKLSHEEHKEILPTTDVPSESQIDQEALEALPEDLRAEVLAQYHRSPVSKLANQSVLPQSPRKDRAIKLPKKLKTPTKTQGRPRGIGSLYNSKTASKATGAAGGGYSTLTQSNFIAAVPTNKNKALNADTAATDASDSATTDKVNEEFLSALPEDIRREVLAQQRRSRLQKRGGIDLSANNRRRQQQAAAAAEAAVAAAQTAGQRTLTLSPLPPKPTFTSRRLSCLPDLRDAISAWYDEFTGEGEKGPYVEDVDALVKYLERVVGEEEGDMAKAVSVVRWLKWVVGGDGSEPQREEETTSDETRRDGDRDGADGEEQITWLQALRKVEDGVQGAVRKRGLGRVEF